MSGGQILPRRVERHAKNARLWPLQGGDHIAAGFVPDLRGSREANGSDVPPVAAERHTIEKLWISLTPETFSAGLGVPELERLMGHRGKRLAVGAEGHAAHHHLEAGDREEFLAGPDVPELHGLIHASRKETLAIGAKGHAENRLLVTMKGTDLLAGLDIPELY